MRGALRVDEVGGPNWAAALGMLLEGGYVVYQGVGLTTAHPTTGHTEPLGALRVRVFTEWQAQNLTESRARADLARGQAIVERLQEESPEVRDLALRQGVEYELLDDYGMGAVLIGTLTTGDVQWHWAPWCDRPDGDSD